MWPSPLREPAGRDEADPSGFGGAGKPPEGTPPSQQHTGSVVPVWARGPRASEVLGTNDHTDLFDLLRGGS